MKRTLLAAVFFFVTPLFAHAATLSISADPNTPGVGDVIQITAQITSVDPVNAFSGTLVYSPQSLEPIQIHEGNSIVSVWITKPTIASSTGTISFAGLTPGGFTGRNGALFNVLFRAKARGQTSVTIRNPEVLDNDGAGTKAEIALTPLALPILATSTGSFTEATDVSPPEPFTLYLAHDPALFGGAYYVAFSAVDKQSGIARYEIAERHILFWPLSWKETQSPALLSDQTLTSDVYVRATDAAGNTRIAELSRTHVLTAGAWGGILILILVCAGYVLYRKIFHK